MTFYIVTLGCPKNEVDSDRIARLLIENGHLPSQSKRNADILIVNTCGFIDTAKEESVQAILKAAAGKKPGQKLIAAGCLAQRYPTELTKEIPQIDAIVGTRDLAQITEVVGRGTEVVSPGHFLSAPISGSSAYLKIADGCSASCGFCAIPMIKGPYNSRPQDEIIAEAKDLFSRGAKEIILIAQDTTAYGLDWRSRDALPDLVENILAAVPDLPWLRIMYAYPTHISDRFINLMAEKPQICHYLDLPLQHAHPDTLKRMRRPSDINNVRRLIGRLRSAIPDIAIRTSFIVGYPGETDDEFGALLSFVREMKFDRVGVFTYSQEEGTYAANLPDQISHRVKKRRYSELMRLQQGISLERNCQMVGEELAILLESMDLKKGRTTVPISEMPVGGQLLLGRSYRDAPEVDGLVFLRGKPPESSMVRARITEALEYDLIGEIIS